VGAGLAQYAFGAPATTVASPYGPLGAFDANGISLPPGFTSRQIARNGQAVPGTGYVWHSVSDGAGTFASLAPGGAPDGGWYFVSNSELDGGAGGCSAVRFNSSGNIIGAQRVLSGTSRNCSGGPTPWGTWLSCEEVPAGTVWEVDPTATNPPVQHPALGTFNHEAACVDPVRQHVYLTEDMTDGCLYRFTPTAYPDLSAGKLEVAFVAGDNSVTWQELLDPDGAPIPTRHQRPTATRFNGGEGMWYDEGKVYFTTKGDRKVWIYDAATSKIEVLYDLALANSDTPMREVDNTVVSKSGDLFICEDGDNFEICLITPDRYVSAFLRLDPAVHGAPGSNETSGAAFDPTGTRLYFAAQRSFGAGAIYEVSGPFRVSRPAPPLKPGGTTTTPTTQTTQTSPATTASAPPPAPGPQPAADRTRPVVRVRSLVSALSMRSFLQRGLSIQLDLDELAGVEVVLRAPGFGVLGRQRTTVAVRGLVRLRVRVSRAELRRRLRRRRRTLRAELTAVVTDASGNRTTIRRTVRVTPPR
jgi:secreted PhoX family phosphatase